MSAMAFDAPVLSLFGKRHFWTDYFWFTENQSGYAELEDSSIVLPLPGEHQLILTIAPQFSEVTLYLADTSAAWEPIQLGWDDQAHWHPDVLRWEECLAICRWCARSDARLPHPGIPLLLLHRFAPITAGDDLQQATEALVQACQLVGVFSDEELHDILDRADHSEDDYHWTYDHESGWTLCGEDAYTLRGPHKDEFQFTVLENALDGVKKAIDG
jgi:hypothetical protein